MAETPRPAFGRRDVGRIAETPLVASVQAQPLPSLLARKQTPLDLQGKTPAVFLIGPNGSGKTTGARLIVENALEEGRNLAVAALDKGDRTLARFFPGVEMPPSKDPMEVARWLSDLLAYVSEAKAASLFDCGGGGGGDEYLVAALRDTPTLVEDLGEEGIAVVALYFLSPRQTDLQVLLDLEKAGFRPAATVFVLNEMYVERGASFDEVFDRIANHSAFRSALGRGAYVVGLPRLQPQSLALEVADKFLRFGSVGTPPEGSTVTPVKGLDVKRVERWRRDATAALQVIAGGLP